MDAKTIRPTSVRRWPAWQFSLRTLLVLIVVIGLGLWLPRRKSMSQHSLAHHLQKQGITVIPSDYSDRQSSLHKLIFGSRKYDDVETLRFEGAAFSKTDIEQATGFDGIDQVEIYDCPQTEDIFRQIAPIQTVEELHVERSHLSASACCALVQGWGSHISYMRFIDSPIESGAFECLPKLHGLNMISMYGVSANRDNLAAVTRCQKLRFLGLQRTSIENKDVAPISNLLNLQDLVIRKSPLNGTGFHALADLPWLRSLDLEGSAITDEGLEAIAGIKSLRSLRLYSTRVTKEGVLKFQQARPDCRVGSDHTQDQPDEQ